MAVTEKPTHQKTRVVSVVAATAIALACGTNYAYSAWAPQFAEKLQLSTTQSNIIGTAGNMGMYAAGIPVGMITDRKSPRLAALIGVFSLFGGYYPIRFAYDDGAGSMSVALLSFCSFLSGVGSCAAFQAAMKVATLNWPTHRGTATAFPLAAFGVVDHRTGTGYAVLPTNERTRRNSNVLHQTRSNGSKHSSRYSGTSIPHMEPNNDERDDDSDEISSLLSGPGDIIPEDDAASRRSGKSNHSHCLDVTGLALLYKFEFWQIWVIMGLLTGVGLMTINNIGHDAQALWNHWDPTASKDFVAHRQLWHVSIISLGSFSGRLLSGIGSDVIVKRLGGSRFWCVVVAATVFVIAQVCATRIENPNHLWAVSGLCGLAYGILFGVLPAVVVDAFGPDNFAVNWGVMTLAPVVSGNIFNLFYGAVYDSHSEVQVGGEFNCDEGIVCYKAAYYVTLVSSALGIVACLWAIQTESAKRTAEELEDHQA
ncbi:major facilitator superfamily transporter [Paraphaeosphaeria minitans]|uniref:Major facilitator superfamily transporter n=1 Tax=Paraphaeosphaeria minitans TaxID=565426 RepID=A0A9P6G5C7_9PLEO|nr:major facilitator superfamily transporter [Paraphaeosphaeria minitans]